MTDWLLTCEAFECLICSALVADLAKHARWHEGPKTRATRVPDPFPVTDEMALWAAENYPGFDWAAESQVFLDYWRARPGKDGMKLDWVATWRNWIRRKA